MLKNLTPAQWRKTKELDSIYATCTAKTDASWEWYQSSPNKQRWDAYQLDKQAEREALDALELFKHELSMDGYNVPKSGYRSAGETNEN